MAQITINIQAKLNNPPNSTGWVSISLISGTSVTITYNNLTTDTDPPYGDPEGDELESIKIERLPIVGDLKINGVTASVGDVVTKAQLENSELTYDSVSSTDNYLDSEFEFLVSDIGSGLYYEDPGSVVFSVKGSRNKAPSNVGNGIDDISAGETVTFTVDMLTTQLNLPYLDPENNPAYKLRIDRLPTSGKLKLAGVDVLDNQEIFFYASDSGSAPSIDNGDLKYINTNYEEGIDGFSFSISDSGSKEFRG